MKFSCNIFLIAVWHWLWRIQTKHWRTKTAVADVRRLLVWETSICECYILPLYLEFHNLLFKINFSVDTFFCIISKKNTVNQFVGFHKSWYPYRDDVILLYNKKLCVSLHTLRCYPTVISPRKKQHTRYRAKNWLKERKTKHHQGHIAWFITKFQKLNLTENSAENKKCLGPGMQR